MDSRTRTTQAQIHLCPECPSNMVYPTEWFELNESWSLKLRCPNCEWRGKGVYRQDEVDNFDDVLNQGTDLLIDGLERLSHLLFSEYVEDFCLALDGDHLLPEDF